MMTSVSDIPIATTARTVAVIGSFRQHIERVREAVDAFMNHAWAITSPPGGELLEPGIDFVRFPADDPQYDDPTIQTIALHRILRADLIFVTAPDGYVGRTTCYEIGRAIQADRVLYFSDTPVDLPLRVPTEVVAAAEALAVTDVDALIRPSAWTDPDGRYWERALIEGRFLEL